MSFLILFLEISKQRVPTEDLQFIQEKIFVKADDDSYNNRLYNCLHWTFFSDFKNNDASIMKDILLRNTDSILKWMEEVIFFF